MNTERTKRIGELTDQIRALHEELAELRQRQAEDTCKFKSGEIITDGKWVGRIVAINPSYDGIPDIFIRRILKSGAEGQLHEFRWYDYDKLTLVKR